MAVGAIVTGIVLHALESAGPTGTTGRPAAVAAHVVPRADGLDCPQDVQWSPDGSRVVMLGYRLHCLPDLMIPAYNVPPGPERMRRDDAPNTLLSVRPVDQPLTGLALVYDTRSGKLVAQIQPDIVIQQRYPIPASVQNDYASINERPQLEIAYTHALWLPDGKTLAITFTTFVPFGPPPAQIYAGAVWPGTAVQGVVLTELSGTNMRVLAQTAPYPGPNGPLEWDLTMGKLVDLQPSLASTFPLASLAPAQTYAWGPNGALDIAQPLRRSAAPVSLAPAPIGAPDGGMSFTLWQPGVATFSTVTTADIPPRAWMADFAALSPDGRYLLDSASIDANVQLAGDVSAGLSAPHWPSLAVHDAGFQTFWTQTAADAQAHQLGDETAYAAWRPDGKILAVQWSLGNDPLNPQSHQIRLYDCATGKQLVTLVPLGTGLPTDQDGEPNQLRWSPDGAHLFLYDTRLGTVTIWGPAQLPPV